MQRVAFPDPSKVAALVLALLVGFVPLGPCAPALAEEGPAEEEAVAPWHDEAKVEAALEEACEAVEAISGAPFEKRPDVRITTPDELREILYRELKPVFEASDGLDALDGTIATMSRAFLAKYDDATHTIHVMAHRLDETQGAHLADGSADLDFLRVLLAHEAAHAHDWPRYGWDHAAVAPSGQDALQALNAVIEGHAQYVAVRAAKRMGIPNAFDRVTSAIVSVPPIEQEALRPQVESLVAALGFGYVQGHAFVEAVAAAQGEAGLRALLRKPPTRTRTVEFPDEYLEPQTESEVPDLDRAIEAFRPLVGDAAWTVSTTRLLKAQLAPVSLALPEAYRDAFVQGVLEGHVLAGQMAAEDRSVVGLLLYFATEEGGRSFLEGDRKAQEAKDAAGGVPGLAEIVEARYEDGAGSGGRLPGYLAKKVVKVGDEEVHVRTHSFALGRLVGQVLVVNTPEIDRKAQDAALERLARYLEDPRQAEASGVFDAPAVTLERSTHRLVVEVRGPAGESIPRARVLGISDAGFARGEVHDGRAEIDVPASTLAVRVWRARDEHGEPLNLTPSVTEGVAADQATLAVTLEAGATLRGRVLDADGAPVEGLAVEARPAEPVEGPPRFGGFAHATAETDAEGAFLLVGLEPGGGYEVHVETGDAYAPADPAAVEAGADDVLITLHSGTRPVLTVVDGAGGPVADAHVEIAAWPGLGAQPQRTFHTWNRSTDARGRARLPALLPDAPYDLRIQPPAARLDLARYRDSSWRPVTERVELAPGFSVRGVVRDEQGAPVRAVVTTRGRELVAGSRVWPDQDVTQTDVEGRFALHHLPGGEVRLFARPADAPPWFPGEDELDFVVVHPGDSEVVLTLTPPSVLRVRVLDDEGRPVPRARLALQEGSHTRFERIRDGQGRVPRPQAAGTLVVFDARGRDGKRLPLGPATVDVRASEAEVEVRLEPGAAIAGRVVDSDGQGVKDARISWEVAGEDTFGPLGAADPGPDADVRTGKDGGFRLVGLARRTYRLHASAEGYATTPPRAVEAGTEDLVLELARGGRYRILVLDADGHPLSGARVSLRFTEQLSPSTTRSRPVPGGATGGDGVCLLAGIQPHGHYELLVRPPRRAASLVAVDDPWTPEHTTIRLQAGYFVTGRVLTEDGSPAAGALVDTAPRVPGRIMGRMPTGSAGRFRLGPFHPGPVRVRAAPRSDRPLEFGRDGESPEVTATPDAPEVVLRLPGKAEPVRLCIVGGAGRRTVWLRRKLEDADEPWDAAARHDTDEHGVLELASLTPGTYRVFVSGGPDDRIGYLPGVVIRGGEVEVELVEPLEIRVRLVAPEGSRYPEVTVHGPMGLRTASALPDGTFLAPGLPPGTWEVSAKVRAPNAWLRSSTRVEAGTEAVIELAE